VRVNEFAKEEFAIGHILREKQIWQKFGTVGREVTP
jgi:hypothetical protein